MARAKPLRRRHAISGAQFLQELPSERLTTRSLLSRNMMLEHLRRGTIVVDPFDERNLKTTSYDVRLGRYYFREQSRRHTGGLFNPFDERHVRAYWGEPQEAELARKWMERTDTKLNVVTPEDRIILLAPGETILAHTEEFIGGRHCVSTEMRARSSMGRIGITVCKCAGWGDLGYVNRWTMEMTNHLIDSQVVLVVGMRVAQIIFYQVDPLDTSYAREAGKYQASDDLAQIKAAWTPDAMIPKLYRDYEVREGFPLTQEEKE